MGKPLYLDIFDRIASDIMSGAIKPGAKIPSKRQMQALLNVSQTTVETAYAALAAEGYILPKAGSGYYACEIEKPVGLTSPSPQSAGHGMQAAEEWEPACFREGEPARFREGEPARFREGDPACFREGEPARRREGDGAALRFLSTNDIDTGLFPFSAWAKIMRETVYNSPSLLNRGDPAGDIELRRELCSFLREIRGVVCAPEQIIIGAGMDCITDILLQLLPEDASFGLENPGYKSICKRLEISGKKVFPIPVDGQGLMTSELESTDAQIAYVTPSHQFPTGVTMPIARRMSLLSWAGKRGGRYIIEDDYDSEFRYSAKTVPAMQGMDGLSKVIYIGTFSRTLAPSIRIAYAVLPPSLMKRYRELFRESSCTVSRFEQQTLASFMGRGLYARHLRRAGNAYKQKQTLFRGLLSETEGLCVSGAEAGLHFLVTVRGIPEKELVSAAANEGIGVYGLSDFRQGKQAPSPDGTAVVGFAGLSADDIPDIAGKLCRAWRSI